MAIRASCALVVSFGVAAPALAQTSASLVSVSTFGNLHAAGVVATVSGDTDGDATVSLEWRLPPGSFQPAHPLVRTGATRFAGSLFRLQPGTAYEVRVQIADPDGVVGSPTATAALSTRAEALPQPTLRTLYVAPGGNDGNPGTDPGAPLLTVQHAANLAQAGDLILIQPGVYRETVNVPASGTAAQPIVFRGNGPGAVLDGADGAVAAGVAWTAGANGVYSRALGFATAHVVTEGGRLFPYISLPDLTALAAGAPGGFYFDGTTLFVKFADLSSPASHAMHVARQEQAFLVDGQSFVRIENLEIRHYGTSFGKGVYLRFAADAAVRSCRIHEVGTAGVWVKGGDRHRIEDNEVWDTSIFDWSWNLVKGSPAEDTGIYFTDDVGRGHVVRRNTVHGFFNGIGPCGGLPAPSGETNETDVYDNEIYDVNDDAFEPEGSCANVRIFENRLHEVFVPIAAAPAGIGPTWVVRNVARFGNTRTHTLDGFQTTALKLNSGFATPVGPLLVYHNTFVTDVAGGNAFSYPNAGNGTVVRSRNNLFAGTRYVIEDTTTGPHAFVFDWDGDDLYTTDGSQFVKWVNVRYATLPLFRAASGLELQGISAPPQLVNPAGGVFRPAAGSPLVDAGLVLPGINDGYVGARPDIGAVETDPDDLIFEDGFESGGLSAWSLSTTDGGDLSASGPAALAGTTVGLRADVNDLNGLYVQDDSPGDEHRYRARFYVDPNGFDPGETQSHFRTRIFIAFSENPMRRVAAIVLKRQGGLFSLMGRARLDDGRQADTGFFSITDGPHAVELDLVRASGPDALDGTFQLWIDGVSKIRVTGLDDSLTEVDFARMGVLSLKTGAAGTMYLDEFESRRSSYIGPLP
jgi:hypothetical protein